MIEYLIKNSFRDSIYTKLANAIGDPVYKAIWAIYNEVYMSIRKPVTDLTRDLFIITIKHSVKNLICNKHQRKQILKELSK